MTTFFLTNKSFKVDAAGKGVGCMPTPEECGGTDSAGGTGGHAGSVELGWGV